MHRSGAGYNLYDSFAKKQIRVVCNNWSVQYANYFFQINAGEGKVRLKDTVLECKRLDERNYITSKVQKLDFKEIAQKPVKIHQQIIQKDRLIKHKPAKDRPWRLYPSTLGK